MARVVVLFATVVVAMVLVGLVSKRGERSVGSADTTVIATPIAEPGANNMDARKKPAVRDAPAPKARSPRAPPASGVTAEQGQCPESMKVPEDPERCPNEEHYLQSWAMLRRKRQNKSGDNSGEAERESWTIVDVGANKGYTIASLLESLGVVGDVKLDLAKAVMKRGAQDGIAPRQLCGFCCDCGTNVLISDSITPAVSLPPAAGDPSQAEYAAKAPPMDVNVFAFEAMSANAKFLADYYSKVKSTRDDQHVNVTVTQAALGATGGTTVPFPVDKFGVESNGINEHLQYNAKPRQKKPVPMTTLDEALPPSLERIDVLLTDTEGHDYFVNDGASRWFPNQLPADGQFRPKVGMYVFETHGTDRPLGAMIRKLAGLGYRCYFPLQRHLSAKQWQGKTLPRTMVEITPPCYLNEYDTSGKGWKNVVCVDKYDEDLVEVMKFYSGAPRRPRKCAIPAALPSAFPQSDWSFATHIGGKR